MNTDFFSMVMKHFHYLVTDYGFIVKKVENSERNPQTEGRIEFESSTTFVTVSGEQFGADASIGRVKDDKYYFNLDPRTIHEYLSLTEAEKRLVLSLNPKDDRKARMLLRQSRLEHTKTDSNRAVDDIDNQLVDYSNWLLRFAQPFLKGDFSEWLEIYEYKVARNRAAYIRSGKEEFVGVGGRDKGYKESIFQRSLNYLNILREEYRKT